ncbi:MAG: 16S rRNA (guanine(966)-N(2))-methyltransferase RsmD [Polyangiaceae bacterium]|jgi:16S rRNA (guanine966-N2)-methyltransferase|nr:16S rRNA (guanine(966)-N(2))-methyltransferase RsmD [Polyangiaceae bacterium]
MRVIGGQFGGRHLRAPPGRGTRPTTDRVRGALFNILGPSVQGARALDLYAGSGALGIEALSRGAMLAVFVEKARIAADTVRANLATLHLHDPSVARVLQRSIEQSVPLIASLGPFDLCLVDPPFEAVREGTALRALADVVRGNVLHANALVVVEIPADQPDPYIEGLAPEAVRAYGDTRLVFLRQLAAP